MRIKFDVKSVTLKFNIRKAVGRCRTQFFSLAQGLGDTKRIKMTRMIYSIYLAINFGINTFRYIFGTCLRGSLTQIVGKGPDPWVAPKPLTGNEFFCSISRKACELAHRAKQVSLICTQGR